MPIFSDLSLYYCGSSTSFSPSFYSNQISSLSSPSTSYVPRGGIFSGFSSGLSTLNSPTRLLPMPPRVNKYSPLLPTISETTPFSAYPRRPLPRISSPRVVPAYRPPRPVNIDTADIDVTTPRKRTDRVLRDRDDPQQGTIKRGRTVVRIHTKRLKENPELVKNRRKTPGEKLVEKFLIKDKAAEEAKRRKLEEEASSSKHVHRDIALVKVEAGNSTPPRRQDAQVSEVLIDFDKPEERLAKNHVPEEEEQEVLKVTQSEALDILLSETESETVTPAPSKKRASVKDKGKKSNTIKKRPKKRDKGSTIKSVDRTFAEVTQKPVEKSLLQRRNTVKNLRRNSRDVEPLALVINENETSIPSTSAEPLLTPASSTTSLSTESTTSTPVDSTSSTPVSSTPITPPLGLVSSIESVPLEVIKSVVPESDSLQRDTNPLKADSDYNSKPNIYNMLSVEASVENAGDMLKKLPLKFVVDEIKVEETPKPPKSPKLFRYEVTVEEIADKKLPFQKQGSDNQSKFQNENGIYVDRDATYLIVKNDLKQAENVMKCDSSLIRTQKEETESNSSGIPVGKTVGIIPKGPTYSETVSQFEVSLSNVGEDRMRQVDAVSFSSENSSNEKGENREIVTATSEISNIPSVSPTSSKQDTEGGSKLPEAELKSEEFFSILPKEESKTLPIEKKLKKCENLKDKTLTNKFTVKGEETEALEVTDTHRTEKDICNKKLVESSKIAEKSNSRQIFENMLAIDRKIDRPDIPAWKKALIAKTQASNTSKLQDSLGLQHKSNNLKLNPIPLSPNKDDSIVSSSNTSTETNLKTCVELSVKEAEPLSQEVKTSAISLSTISCSERSNPKITEQQEIVKIKAADAGSVCWNSTPDKTDLQSGKSELGEKLNIQVTEKHETNEAVSVGQKIKPSEEADMENEMKVPADLNVNKGQESKVKEKVVENKLKYGEVLSAGEAKSAETQLENVKVKYTEMSPIAATKATEAKLKESKPKPANEIHSDKMKPAKVKVTDSKLKPQTSSEQNSPAINVTECKIKPSALVKLGTPEMKPLDTKVKSVQTSPIEGKVHVIQSTAKEVNFMREITVATEIKSVDKKIIPVAESPVEKMKSTETEISSVEEPEVPEIREILNDALETPTSSSSSTSSSLAFVETPAVNKSESVETAPKPFSVGNETELEETKPPEKKATPVQTKVFGHSEFCEVLAVEKEKPGVTSVMEKEESASDAAVTGPSIAGSDGKAETNPVVSLEKETSSEEETDSEEETESETDSDDGEEVTRPSQRASTSSSEDSGFDSLPTSVPGSTAYNKGPNSKDCDVNCHKKCEKLMPHLCGVNQKLIVEALTSLRKAPSCSSGSSTDSVASTPALSSNSALRLDPYDDHSPTSTLTRSGRVTPPATTIPRFRKYTVEDFQFLKLLGKGSFGKVLLAELKGTECYYAVKCLKKDVVLEDDDVECTLIERKVLALGTKHPYLCHLFCTFQTESHLFFVMEYLNGGDLMFHIQQTGRFPEARARFYAAEIISGLKFLHKKGVVYRDLKLDNILLDFDGHVRIADFGMCKLQIYLDRTADTFCGTPDYMAPEIIKGLKYNQCVDWWSFGVLLYEMLIGQSPFSGCDEDDLFWCICNEQPRFPRFLSREANSILSLLLEKDASKRLGTSACMAGDVMDQPFFRNVDWNALEHRELEPPFKPRVQHPLDVQYFDKAFTAERAKLTPVDRGILQSMDQTQFQGFSYTNPNATD